MPICLLKCGKRPLDRLPVQAGTHMLVEDDIRVIVEIDEVVARDWRIDRQGGRGNKQAQYERAFGGRTKQLEVAVRWLQEVWLGRSLAPSSQKNYREACSAAEVQPKLLPTNVGGGQLK